MAGPGWAGLNGLAGMGPVSFAFDLMGCMAGPGWAGLNGLAGMGPISFVSDLMG